MVVRRSDQLEVPRSFLNQSVAMRQIRRQYSRKFCFELHKSHDGIPLRLLHA